MSGARPAAGMAWGAVPGVAGADQFRITITAASVSHWRTAAAPPGPIKTTASLR